MDIVTLHELRKLFENDSLRAIGILKEILPKLRSMKGGHSEWGRLCEEMGQEKFALSEYQLALRDDPDDLHALERLFLLYSERGELEKALQCAERRFSLEKKNLHALKDLVTLYLENDMAQKAREAIERAHKEGVEEDDLASLDGLVKSHTKGTDMELEEQIISSLGIPSDADVIRFMQLFTGRENVYARQWWDESGNGGYASVRQPLVFDVIKNHLLGSITVGVYPVRLDNTVTFFAIDVDINKRAITRARGERKEARRLKTLVDSEARRLSGELKKMGIFTLMEDSGYKGRHLWAFLEEPIDAGLVRQFGSLFLSSHPIISRDLHLEFFPKQSAIESRTSNLIKLPLGVHRRTGRRGLFLTLEGHYDSNPFSTLQNVQKTTKKTLFEAILALKKMTQSQDRALQPSEEESIGLVELAPPKPPPAWTDADFETREEISHLLKKCPVLAALKEKVEIHKRMTHDEQIVLIHSLGHSSEGVCAVNYLFDNCVDVPSSARLKSLLSGNPISCPKIRKRIPHITAKVDCNCSFDFATDHYPTPRLHLMTLKTREGTPEKKEDSWDPIERTRALCGLRRRREQLEEQIAELERELLSYLEKVGRDHITLEEGKLILHYERGSLPSLEWRGVSGEELERRKDKEK